jgi:ElaB/YqjD/DUF883 family membrane-anchored ribosome-binding protein
MADTTDRITPATAKRDTPAPADRTETPATGGDGTAVAARPVRGNGRPTDAEAMRAEIARTRARLSRTLDDIEDRIVAERRALERTKEELWEKATLQGVRKKLSREPWRSVGIAFVVGYVIAAIRD